ncbi:MAG: NAD-dependent epimerase/dehydratase family protein [Candidatus Bathyarchaeia archaeon]
MRVAVTGGAGYIGSTLVKELVEEGENVVSVDNLMRGDYKHLKAVGAHEKAELHEGDIRVGKLLLKLFEGTDAIAHLAALPGLVLCRERPEEAVSINIYGTHQVLEAARKLDIEKIVFCSSAAVYGRPVELPVTESHPLRPLNLYGVTKLSGEKLMEVYWDNYGIKTISLRFGNVYGVGLFTNYETVIPKFVRQGLDGEPLTVYGDGDSSRDFVHVKDIVQAIVLSLKAMEKGGEVFNVGGETIKIGALASFVSESIERSMGKEVNITHLPPRIGETKHFSYNLEKIEKELGYRPNWNIRPGIEQIIKYRLDQIGIKI